MEGLGATLVCVREIDGRRCDGQIDEGCYPSVFEAVKVTIREPDKLAMLEGHLLALAKLQRAHPSRASHICSDVL